MPTFAPVLGENLSKHILTTIPKTAATRTSGGSSQEDFAAGQWIDFYDHSYLPDSKVSMIV